MAERRSLRVSINDARFCLLESNRMLSIILATLFFQQMHNAINTDNVFHEGRIRSSEQASMKQASQQTGNQHYQYVLQSYYLESTSLKATRIHATSTSSSSAGVLSAVLWSTLGPSWKRLNVYGTKQGHPWHPTAFWDPGIKSKELEGETSMDERVKQTCSFPPLNKWSKMEEIGILIPSKIKKGAGSSTFGQINTI